MIFAFFVLRSSDFSITPVRTFGRVVLKCVFPCLAPCLAPISISTLVRDKVRDKVNQTITWDACVLNSEARQKKQCVNLKIKYSTIQRFKITVSLSLGVSGASRRRPGLCDTLGLGLLRSHARRLAGDYSTTPLGLIFHNSHYPG